MITALVSGLFGLANAFLPDLFGFFKRRQEATERAADRAHELLMLDKQVEVAERTATLKIEEVKMGGILDAVRAAIQSEGEQMKAIYAAQKPIGNRFVDGWNALLRPMAVTGTFLIFMAGALLILYGTLQAFSRGTIDPSEAGAIILGGVLGEFIQAVWGYLFGYRGGLKVKELTSRL